MGHTSPIETFLNQHKSQLLASGVPEVYWEPLYKKLLTQTFDAGKSFQLVKIEYDEPRQPHEPLWGLQAITDLDKNDADNIYLIDHAWTYQINEARKHLEYDALRLRMADMLGLNPEPKHELIDEIFDNMWRINSSYTVRTMDGTEQNQIWYIMDEIGCAVQHSDAPNCRVVPFFHHNDGVYSLLFMLKNIEEGELTYRDFAEGVTDPLMRKAVLLPWVPTSFELTTPSIPDADYFLSGHIPESLPDLDVPIISAKKDKYLVYSQYSLVKKHLTDSRFELTDDEDRADVLWFTEHFRDFNALSHTPGKLVNQFPYEYVLTVKDLLCMTCRRYRNNTELAPWFPVTFNLVNEIGNFVGYYQKHGGYWIVKPYNLARGMDMQITNNLNYIMRLPATGPKIAQQYLTNPVLFHRPDCNGKVKFDIRYVILLKSARPLEVYVYKNFFLRFANKPFELNNFDDYETHFTVMNYTDAALKHLKCEEFKVQWPLQYPSHKWDEVEQKILHMIKEVMECATSVEPPCGIAENPQSRALYAIDLMLDWKEVEMQPKILEINFMPDCERACNYYPDFYNDIFRLLFLGEESDEFFKL